MASMSGAAASARPSTADRLRVAVVGAGAVGGVFGARLAQAGHAVHFVARGATLAALIAHGLRLDSVDGDLRLPPVAATDDPRTIGPVDLVLVAVKATQVAALAPALRALLAPHTVVIPLQNGVEASSQLAAELGPDHVLEGLCRVIVEQVAPGHLRHSAVTPLLEFGPRGGSPLAEAVQDTAHRVARAIEGAGMHVVTPTDMAVALWEKFLFIEPIGAVGAAAQAPFGVVRTIPETRHLIDVALDEVMAVGSACGVAWPHGAKAHVWRRYDGLPADGFTSLARDLMARRPSEFDAQTAAVVRLARTHAVATPAHDLLYAVLLPSALPAT
ncbi:MAG: ketopantoate reductase family protein [Gemmatimonas sp.]|jgi:2-dehydropantoate 2-reductase|uniref:ketopantoate reductase family protein n=1 Tax=Gemmatimonas sp. TaxID=1962908 RepID=UPI00391F09FE|nr:2-dehydropantoate 2-reductase [Gemmatimonadota bacterium]